MEKDTFQQLLDKYLDGTANPTERSLVEEYYKRLSEDKTAQELTEEQENNLRYTMMANIQQAIGQEIKTLPKRRVDPIFRIAAAASIAFVIGVAGYFYYHGREHAQQLTQQQISPILPGGNKAILTLAGGKRISLTDAANGNIAQQAGVQITKSKDGELIYTLSDQPGPISGETGNEAMNTIETPRGGQYRVNLPDGTKVWLNAATVLKYPARFTGTERKVELQGEAYFEVVHNEKQPFRVMSKGQVVEDIGTHFNINNYADETATRTTLLEGAVSINNKTTLTPGQQAVLQGGAFKVQEVDTEDIIAWKEGTFQFTREPLESIMRKVSRWYNVDIDFTENSLKGETISGTVSRMADVTKVLRRIELTGEVRFKIEGRKIIVLPKRKNKND